ncbi:MAG: DUF4870 family protein [Pseudomonadota bacterium]
MTDPAAPPAAPERPKDRDAAKLVYILYFVGFFVPLTALAGLILAYVKRGGPDPVAESHYKFQIRSFWMGLLAVVVGGALAFVLIGYLVLLAWIVWALFRFITGLLKLLDGLPVADPMSWGLRA